MADSEFDFERAIVAKREEMQQQGVAAELYAHRLAIEQGKYGKIAAAAGQLATALQRQNSSTIDLYVSRGLTHGWFSSQKFKLEQIGNGWGLMAPRVGHSDRWSDSGDPSFPGVALSESGNLYTYGAEGAELGIPSGGVLVYHEINARDYEGLNDYTFNYRGTGPDLVYGLKALFDTLVSAAVAHQVEIS